MHTLYSVIIHKATRAPIVASSGNSREKAIERACELYESSKLFSKHKTLDSGVAVLVFDDDEALRIVSNGFISVGDFPLITYQCGGW